MVFWCFTVLWVSYMLTCKTFGEIGNFFAKQLCIFTFCVLKSLQVVFGFPPGQMWAGTPPVVYRSAESLSAISPLPISLPRSRLPAAGARAAIANQIQLSREERLRRPDGHILRIISAKFCSPVRKLVMERVNGQDGDGARWEEAKVPAMLHLALFFSPQRTGCGWVGQTWKVLDSSILKVNCGKGSRLLAKVESSQSMNTAFKDISFCISRYSKLNH